MGRVRMDNHFQISSEGSSHGQVIEPAETFGTCRCRGKHGFRHVLAQPEDTATRHAPKPHRERGFTDSRRASNCKRAFQHNYPRVPSYIPRDVAEAVYVGK